MHDGIAVYAIDLRQDAPFELLFVGDANVAQHRAGELGEEAFDEIEPGAVFGQEGECEASLRLLSQPGPGFLGLVLQYAYISDPDGRTAWRRSGPGCAGGARTLEYSLCESL